MGLRDIPLHPDIIRAFNPYYAIRLLVTSPEWFLILGAVFLCTTGVEALYSDLGHCGRRNITISWLFVKLMLIFNYLGQGAWLVAHEGAHQSRSQPVLCHVARRMAHPVGHSRHLGCRHCQSGTHQRGVYHLQRGHQPELLAGSPDQISQPHQGPTLHSVHQSLVVFVLHCHHSVFPLV